MAEVGQGEPHLEPPSILPLQSNSLAGDISRETHVNSQAYQLISD